METKDGIISFVSKAIVTLNGVLGVKLDYSPESIKFLEDHINKYRGKVGATTGVTAFYGLYLGEVIVRKFPESEWVDTGDLLSVGVKLACTGDEPHKVIILPVVQVMNFLANKEDSLYTYFLMVSKLASGDKVDSSSIKWYAEDSDYATIEEESYKSTLKKYLEKRKGTNKQIH